MNRRLLRILISILDTEAMRVEEVDAWNGWDHFQEDEDELSIRFEHWGETLQAREFCLGCGQSLFACSCLALLPHT